MKIDDLISKINIGNPLREKHKINTREVNTIKEKYSDPELTVNRATPNNNVDSVEATRGTNDRKKIVDIVSKPEMHDLSLQFIEITGKPNFR